MTGINNRPAPFREMGAHFSAAFGNVDVVPVINNLENPSVRGILRQSRDVDLVEFAGVMVEGVTHTLSIDATKIEALESNRDRVVINGTSYDVLSKIDDGRAMAQLGLKGDI